MNKFLLIAIFIFAFAECCLSGSDGPNWEDDPKAKLIIRSACDVNKRPDATQWANLSNCTRYNEPPPPENDKIQNTVLIYIEKNYKFIFPQFDLN